MNKKYDNSDLLKRILLNMKYDPTKNLNENKNSLKSRLLLEAEPNLCDPPNGQKMPFTMNQIMKFQKYIWLEIEKGTTKVPGTCDNEGKNCSYNSMLCDVKPCKWGKAVDGFWGNNTKLAWTKYGDKYKTKNKCTWWVDDSEISRYLRGQEIPTTSTQIRNFQRWVWLDYEKLPEDNTTKRKSVLCSTPCTYKQAVDGIWGNTNSNTSKAWSNTNISVKYKKDNPKWYVNVEYDKRIDTDNQRSEYIVNNFKFYDANPSGYNGYSQVTDVMKWLKTNAQTLFKTTEEDAKKYVLPNYGWNQNPILFPTPKKYGQNDLNMFLDGGQESSNKIKELDQKKQEINYTSPNMISDRLGSGYGGGAGTFETQQAAMTGSKTKNQIANEDLDKQIKQYQGPTYTAALDWNKKMDQVGSQIQSRCVRPLKFSFASFDDTPNVDMYLSYYALCKNAGGLWVYTSGSKYVCGCRYMSEKNNLLTPSGQANYDSDGTSSIVITGSDGKMKGIDIRSSLDYEMAYQTKGGAQDEIYGDGKWDTHDILNAVELGAIAVAIIGSGGSLAPLFFGIGAIAGIADSVVYFAEGDPYMGTMMLALNLLGVDDIVKLVKWGGSLFKEVTKETIESIAKKKLGKIALTESEKQIYDQVSQFVYKNQNDLSKAMQQQMAYNFATTGIYGSAIKNKWDLKIFFNLLYKLNSIGLGVPGLVLKLGGVALTADQLYLLVNGNDESRKNSGIGKIMDMIYGSEDDQTKIQKLNKDAIEAFKQLQEDIKNNAGKYLNPDAALILFKTDPTQMASYEQIDSYFNQLNQMKGEKPDPKIVQANETNITYVQAPPIKDVIENNKIISFGMSGDSVNEINRILMEKGYSDIVNLELYDELTMWYVSEEQSKNNLVSNGSVDVVTYNVLKGRSVVKDITKMEGCEKYKTLIDTGWVEISKLQYNGKRSNNKSVEKVDCNGMKYLYNENKGIESIYPKTMGGQSPINKTIVDNPNNLNEEITKLKNIMGYL